MSQFLVGQNIVDVVPDVFNGNNSTTGFTLTAATVTNAADVYISGVHQAPTTDYAITGGTTITFTTAPPTGTANILVVYAKAAIVNTPANASVDTIKIADNAVTLAKMAGGTDGNLISYDTNGDPAFVSTGTATHVLTSNGAGAAPTFQASASPDMVLLSTTTASSDATIEFHSVFDNATYSSYFLRAMNVFPGTDLQNARLRTSSDGGSTYDSGASTYYTHGTFANASTNYVANSTTDHITLAGTNNTGSVANTEGLSLDFHLLNPAGSTYTHFMFTDYTILSAPTPNSGIMQGARLSAADVDGLQFYFASGNVASGLFKFYGIK